MRFSKIGIIFGLRGLAAALSTSTQATPAIESSTSTSGANFTAQYKLWKFKGCLKDKTHNDKEAVLDALNEAHKVLSADGNYNIQEHWHDMNAIEFFGNPTDLKSNNQRKGLKKNLQRAKSFTNGWWIQSETTAIYCRDGSLPDKDGVSWSTACNSNKFPDPIVVAPDYHGKDKPALMFCTRWFTLTTLSYAMKSAKSLPEYEAYDLSSYENRGRAWITAMMLIPKIGSSPADAEGKPLMKYQRYQFPGHPNHFATTAAQCKFATKFGRDEGFSFIINPDNISWYTLASYVQAETGEYPIRPLVPLNIQW